MQLCRVYYFCTKFSFLEKWQHVQNPDYFAENIVLANLRIPLRAWEFLIISLLMSRKTLPFFILVYETKTSKDLYHYLKLIIALIWFRTEAFATIHLLVLEAPHDCYLSVNSNMAILLEFSFQTFHLQEFDHSLERLLHSLQISFSQSG